MDSGLFVKVRAESEHFERYDFTRIFPIDSEVQNFILKHYKSMEKT